MAVCCSEAEGEAIPKLRAKAMEEGRLKIGGEQNGEVERAGNKENAEKDDEVPALMKTIKQLQIKVRQLEEKLQDAGTHDWLIVESSDSLLHGRNERELVEQTRDVTKDEIIERQKATIRELRSEIESSKRDGNPLLEFITGRRYTEMEEQLANMSEKVELFRMADLRSAREIATLKSQLEVAQMEAERAMSQLRQADLAAAQSRKHGQTQQNDAVEHRPTPRSEITKRGQPAQDAQHLDKQNDTTESSKLLEEIVALKDDKRRLQQEMVRE